MRRLLAIAILVCLTPAALAQEPAAPEASRESPRATADEESRVVDRAAVAALLPDLLPPETAASSANPAELTADELAAMLADYAGCEAVADALVVELTRTSAQAAPAEAVEATP